MVYCGWERRGLIRVSESIPQGKIHFQDPAFFDSDVIKVITGIRIRHFVYTGASANTDAAKMKK
jgi:hypothetical protein